MKTYSKQELAFLLSRYIEKKCSPEEKKRLYEIMASSSSDEDLTEILSKQLNEFRETESEGNTVDFNRIFNELMDEINLRKNEDSDEIILRKGVKTRKIIMRAASMAAIFCIAFFSGTLFSRYNNQEVAGKPSVPLFTVVRAPLGAKSELKLADGTEIILNAGSSIKYDSDYNTFNRDLSLEGEAYFKVARNTSLPLVVNAGNIHIKATGTEFNVKAYSDEDIIETTLVNGEVQISQDDEGNETNQILVLEPNQKAIYARLSDRLILEKIKEIEPAAVKPAKSITDKLLVSPKTDVEQVTAWTKNKLILKSENLESLCTKLQRKYDMKFVFMDDEIKKNRVTGTLLDETFQQVMDAIMLTVPIEYKLDGKTVLLFSKK